MRHSRKLGYRQIEHVISLHDLPEGNLVHVHEVVGIGQQPGIGRIQKDIEKELLELKLQQSFRRWKRLFEIGKYTIKKSAGSFIDVNFNEHITRLFGKIFQGQIFMIFINDLAKKTVLKIKREHLPSYHFRKLLEVSSLAREQTGMFCERPGFSIVMHGPRAVEGKHDLVV